MCVAMTINPVELTMKIYHHTQVCLYSSLIYQSIKYIDPKVAWPVGTRWGLKSSGHWTSQLCLHLPTILSLSFLKYKWGHWQWVTVTMVLVICIRTRLPWILIFMPLSPQCSLLSVYFFCMRALLKFLETSVPVWSQNGKFLGEHISLTQLLCESVFFFSLLQYNNWGEFTL